ncbi:hypothetical protein MMC12_007689 [Toensbergia leucococca]|nr:hypothetical protein [Toensbergia leucococca]
MPLCTNRPGGFGPSSSLYPNLPTSCFLDSILIPLCTWLYLLTILLLLLLERPWNQRAVTVTLPEDPKTPAVLERPVYPASKLRRSRLQHCGFIIYSLLVLAQLLMCILEITRLSLAHLGIGLLPFTLVGIICAGSLHIFRTIASSQMNWAWKGIRGSRWANLGLWVALLVMDSLKLAQEAKDGTGARKGSKYPVADEMTDVGVMIGVYVVLGVLEVVAH